MALGLVAAACGGDDEDTETSADETEEADAERRRHRGGERGRGPGGGTVTYASDQEPAGWNNLTASENLAALSYLTIEVFPGVFNVLPDLSIELNDEMMESAELTVGGPPDDRVRHQGGGGLERRDADLR
jgi:peptide/nickel transport system substrate-binding protein